MHKETPEVSNRGSMHIGVLGPMSLDLLPAVLPPELQSLPGYPAPIISSIINGYLDRGIRVTAITTSAGLERSVILPADRLTLAIVPRTGPRSALHMFRAERTSILEVLNAAQPDILHAHWSYEFAAAALDSGLPALVTVRDHAPTILRMALMEKASLGQRLRHGFYRLLRLQLNNDVLGRGRFFSVPSPYMRNMMPSRCRATTRVIANFFNPSLQGHALPLDRREKRIVTVSNGFAGWKNVARAISAFGYAGCVSDGWILELIGNQLEPDGPASKWAEQHGLTAGVRFRGPVPYAEALTAIASAAVMLHPALEESFGMTVLEAMALGTPVVGGARSGNVPHLLRDGAGILCDVRSVESMADALDRITGDTEVARETAVRGRLAAEGSYSRDGAMDSYLEYLTGILEQGDGEGWDRA